MKKLILILLAVWVAVGTARGDVNLAVWNFTFTPTNTETLVNPMAVSFDLGNYGPATSGEVQMDFYLSRNSVLGDADDQLFGSFSANLPLAAYEYARLQLSDEGLWEITIPPDACGDYFVFVRAQPVSDIELDDTDNQACAPGTLTVSPLRATSCAAFMNPQIAATNTAVTPGYAFEYNAYYRNNWRIIAPGGGFTAVFTLPVAGEYELKVRHLTSAYTNCPNNGYSPVTILLNGAPVVTDYDVAANHAGTHGYATDTWKFKALAGDNTLEWVAGSLCTHYWVQRIEIAPKASPPWFSAITPSPGGRMHLTLTGEAGLMNVIEASTDLVHWTSLTNLFNATGTVQWADTPPADSNRRFYRVLAL